MAAEFRACPFLSGRRSILREGRSNSLLADCVAALEEP